MSTTFLFRIVNKYPVNRGMNRVSDSNFGTRLLV